jgi:hypothetical protein
VTIDVCGDYVGAQSGIRDLLEVGSFIWDSNAVVLAEPMLFSDLNFAS